MNLGEIGGMLNGGTLPAPWSGLPSEGMNWEFEMSEFATTAVNFKINDQLIESILSIEGPPYEYDDVRPMRLDDPPERDWRAYIPPLPDVGYFSIVVLSTDNEETLIYFKELNSQQTESRFEITMPGCSIFGDVYIVGLKENFKYQPRSRFQVFLSRIPFLNLCPRTRVADDTWTIQFRITGEVKIQDID
jgi:hypothetical protein